MTGPIYAQRPSKDVTRKIFVDMLLRLDTHGDLREYQYVGFGALEFVDFDAVHRMVGISEMYSIENDSNIDRYEANKPYRCISILSGHATDMLTRIKWSGLSIVWLDYECPLNEVIISDVEYLCQKLVPGSVLAVTMNAHPGAWSERRNRLVENIGAHRVPSGTDDDRLGEWGWANVQQRVLFGTIRRALGKRGDSAFWWQALNIHYRDDARMQLVAGVVGAPSIRTGLEQNPVTRALYYRPAADSMDIELPYLTIHEQVLLRKKLPRKARQRRPTIRGVAGAKVAVYERYYRWISS